MTAEPLTGESAPAESLPARPGPVARLVLLPLRGYRRLVSPLLPARCRFAPTCSAYAVEAVTTHGALRGTGLALWRLLRCQPFHPGGHDPVPPTRSAVRMAVRTDRPVPPAVVPRRSYRTGAGRPTERSGVSPC